LLNGYKLLLDFFYFLFDLGKCFVIHV
jgi:hypothetical protein